ncbi:hypothetical protein HMPREF9622_00267 [Cutibacterium modestum HL037PA3]|uniref:Uncharacterized protein n=1 Tax=Cutibacterium modestum HL044PA1 TaxID=765109 RepID=A0ABN0C249_9ACTN|nr:hypothetical protein HMPREF9621_00245 [Cutibacterium modestum HL037PA2]EFS91264.1 hypothetical protein HMPREF9607_02555 [Cutibacterium modestum HL044PA1]EFT16723.1 hypothetical protein HMPREF9622_00267 [Cutibacterium modestum HL037PA3]EGG27284.1 hypothetical protein PA08_1528 [Cutibacterium modestum P08]
MHDIHPSLLEGELVRPVEVGTNFSFMTSMRADSLLVAGSACLH